jgi:fructoselysine/glucoselysine PTS system EIIA component
MRKYLIATHGTFSNGIKSSLDIIAGELDSVYLINAYVDANQSIEAEVTSILNSLSANDELIVFTDLVGGSITNQVLRVIAHQNNVHVISGFNLPLLLEVMLGEPTLPAEELIESSIEKAKEQIIYVNKITNKENND